MLPFREKRRDQEVVKVWLISGPEKCKQNSETKKQVRWTALQHCELQFCKVSCECYDFIVLKTLLNITDCTFNNWRSCLLYRRLSCHYFLFINDVLKMFNNAHRDINCSQHQTDLQDGKKKKGQNSSTWTNKKNIEVIYAGRIIKSPYTRYKTINPHDLMHVELCTYLIT